MKQWCVYILRCADGTLYTGMTDDFPHRLRMHRSGKGAKYTRGRLPVEPVYREDTSDRSAALRREWQLKQLSRQEKLRLIAEGVPSSPEENDSLRRSSKAAQIGVDDEKKI